MTQRLQLRGWSETCDVRPIPLPRTAHDSLESRRLDPNTGDTMDMFEDTEVTTTGTLEFVPRATPFTSSVCGVELTHETYADALERITNSLEPARIVLRRDFGQRRVCAWRDEYNVAVEPDATISWEKGARL